jgi:ankyrin repeat protein
MNEHEAVVKLLLQWGGKVNLKDRYKKTALYYAAANGYEAVVKPTGKIDLEDRYAKTALHHAAGNGYGPVVKLLLDSIAQANGLSS